MFQMAGMPVKPLLDYFKNAYILPVLIPFRVTHSSFCACLNWAAYMCFMLSDFLITNQATVTGKTPSYVLMRETEVAREKELEKVKELTRKR